MIWCPIDKLDLSFCIWALHIAQRLAILTLSSFIQSILRLWTIFFFCMLKKNHEQDLDMTNSQQDSSNDIVVASTCLKCIWYPFLALSWIGYEGFECLTTNSNGKVLFQMNSTFMIKNKVTILTYIYPIKSVKTSICVCLHELAWLFTWMQCNDIILVR